MAAAEVQALLRFLTKDAKIPLADALPKIGSLRKQGLNTPGAIAGAETNAVLEVFVDEKSTKQVINAAKRLTNPKKRTASQAEPHYSKRTKSNADEDPSETETNLALPIVDSSITELEAITVETNRAPLVLAFALVVLEFVMPEQPLSSRLSLAQAVVSANSQTKAKSIGLVSGNTAEEEGWTRGQPKLKVLGREIAVMRRQVQSAPIESDSQDTLKAEEVLLHDAFWGLDVEALRRSSGPLVAGRLAGSHNLPIHTAQSARSYLLKSISIAESDDTGSNAPSTNPKRKKTTIDIVMGREKAAAMLLKSIRMVCESWLDTLSTADLDKRAWSWYLSVRPDVAQGQSGWGQRGKVRLADIIRLKRNTLDTKHE